MQRGEAEKWRKGVADSICDEKIGTRQLAGRKQLLRLPLALPWSRQFAYRLDLHTVSTRVYTRL